MGRALIKGLRERLDASMLAGFVRPPATVLRSAARQLQVNNEARSLSLYQFQHCFYCVKTRSAITELKLPIQIRDAHAGTFREELAKEGGKVRVPCLRIDNGQSVEWLYESDDIIAYLNQRFA